MSLLDVAPTIAALVGAPAELFDLVLDPDEKLNRVHHDPKRVEAMREDLLRWADRQRATVHAGSLASR